MIQLVTTLVLLAPRADVDPQATVLMQINAKRAAHGLYAYKPDAQLQRIAEERCREAARRSYAGHLPGVVCPEGVGWASGHRTNKDVRACWIYSSRWRKAGAAMFYHKGKTYYCVTYR